MSRIMSYADAVRLLGGEGPTVKALERITGGLALVTAVIGAPAALLGWLGARGEFIRLSHELVRSVSERRSGLSRYNRTQRLEAAIAVLVVVAYFEALAETRLPFQFDDLDLTKDEQARLANVAPDGFFVSVDQAFGALPEPYEVPGRRGILREYYTRVSGAFVTFVRGLAVWEQLSETERNRVDRPLIVDVPLRAVERYEELLRRLATDFPEVAFWTNLREHEATRADVNTLGAAMSRLERTLVEISTGRPPDVRRAGLAYAYRATLDRPIVTSGDIPEGLRLPTLGAGYISPGFRVGQVAGDVKLSEESWWNDMPIRDDVEEFLVGYLTSSQATRTPLLVLGQPGAGKSVLTRILAARLPAADFLPVRVILRDVPAAADLQDQIEYAIRDATGERIEWPALVRTAGDALPVVILDGFDELLQATGVAQTDYLRRIADLQQRESDQGRPMAVIVTSRTSVADRARAPDDMVAIRLEPFDQTRVAAWLAVWNEVNAEPFRRGGLTPLTAGAVLAYPELASQPLLLLMLALYDANGNALQRSTTQLREADLYERLLRSFARREVEKHQPGLPERDLELAVEHELRRLSVVAFAMFNRGSQCWVSSHRGSPQVCTTSGHRCGPPRSCSAGSSSSTVPRPAATTGAWRPMNSCTPRSASTSSPTSPGRCSGTSPSVRPPRPCPFPGRP
jgi:hypothetical protein